MNIDNIQSLAALTNIIDTFAKSSEGGHLLTVSISRFSSPAIQLSYELFIGIFDEYELREYQDSSRVRAVTYVNGVEICSIVPESVQEVLVQEK